MHTAFPIPYASCRWKKGITEGRRAASGWKRELQYSSPVARLTGVRTGTSGYRMPGSEDARCPLLGAAQRISGTVLRDTDHCPDAHLPGMRMKCSPPNLWRPLCASSAKNPVTLSSATVPHFLHYPVQMHFIQLLQGEGCLHSPACTMIRTLLLSGFKAGNQGRAGKKPWPPSHPQAEH